MPRLIAAALTVLAVALSASATAHAESDAVTMSATMNGQAVAASTASNPIRLQPGNSAAIEMTITNRGSTVVHVNHVELAGRIVGMTFFNYTTSVDFTVPPGATDTLRYRLDLTGLQSQATGLIGAQLSATGPSGDVVASINTVTDVRGSWTSVYGLFGVTLVVLTILAIVDSAFAIARHHLADNRWQRGLRVLTPGIGIGLVLAFSASAARLWVPNTHIWLVIAASTAAAFFVLGYLSPTPSNEEHDLCTDITGADGDEGELPYLDPEGAPDDVNQLRPPRPHPHRHRHRRLRPALAHGPRP